MSPPRPCRPTTRHPVVAGLLAIALVALLGSAGCGADTAEPPASSTTTGPVATDPPKTVAPTSSTTTTAALGGDEAEVRAVIDRYWDAFIAATTNPDPENAELMAILSGEAETRILGAIEEMRASGQRAAQPPDSAFTHRVTSVTLDASGLATVKECVVDDFQIIDTDTGAVINGAVTTSEYTSTVHNDGSEWRITTREQTRAKDGVLDCSEVSA